MTRKKILYITANTFFGGGEKVFLQLASRLDKNAFDTAFVCEDREPLSSSLKTAGIKLIPVVFGRQFGPGTLFRLAEIFRQEAPDIIHAQGGRVSFYARLAALLAGPRVLKPVIITTTAAPVEEYDVSLARKFAYTLLDKLTERIDDHFITVTGSLKNTLSGRHGISSGRISVIHNGIDCAELDSAKIDPAAFRKEAGIGAATKLVCSIGRLANVKGYDYLLSSAKLLFDENPGLDVKYVIAGEGELRQRIETRARSYGLEGKFILLGHRTDAASVLAASDIFVLSSVREGFPMSLLEAMAMKKAVVSTDFNGVGEIMTGGIEGSIVPKMNAAALKEAVLRYLNNPVEAAKHAENARKKAREVFGLDAVVARHEELYGRLIFQKIDAVSKILLVNVSGIGDFIESFEAIESIKRAFPKAETTLLVSSKAYAYAKASGLADRTLIFPVGRSRGFSISGIGGAFALCKFLLSLRKERFDIAANLYEIASLSGSLRMNLMFKILNPRLSAGRDTCGLGGFFDLRVADAYESGRNNFFYYTELAKLLGAAPANRNTLRYDKNDAAVLELLKNWGISEQDKIAILNPGSDRLTRRWPAENFAETADALSERYGAKIIIIGSAAEAPLASGISSRMKSKAFTAAGKLDFKQLIALISKARVMVTTNSAAMHVAGILGIPFVAVAVSGDPGRDAPQGDPGKMAMLHRNVECNPCSYWDCPNKEHMKCMKLISSREVIESCERFIK